LFLARSLPSYFDVHFLFSSSGRSASAREVDSHTLAYWILLQFQKYCVRRCRLPRHQSRAHHADDGQKHFLLQNSSAAAAVRSFHSGVVAIFCFRPSVFSNQRHTEVVFVFSRQLPGPAAAALADGVGKAGIGTVFYFLSSGTGDLEHIAVVSVF